MTAVTQNIIKHCCKLCDHGPVDEESSYTSLPLMIRDLKVEILF